MVDRESVMMAVTIMMVRMMMRWRRMRMKEWGRMGRTKDTKAPRRR